MLVSPIATMRAMLQRQLSSFFQMQDGELAHIDSCFELALERCERCFSHIKNKYYSLDGRTAFDSLHGCQWAVFLYYLSNSLYREHGINGASEKIYALNRIMSSVDLYYQIELPDVFFFDHPLGSVIGRATFSDYFSFSQGCTVGNNHGTYPRFGHSVFMMSDSKVIGDCAIGDNVIISANTYVKDTDIPSGSMVFGSSPVLIVKTGELARVCEHAEEVFSYE